MLSVAQLLQNVCENGYTSYQAELEHIIKRREHDPLLKEQFYEFLTQVQILLENNKDCKDISRCLDLVLETAQDGGEDYFPLLEYISNRREFQNYFLEGTRHPANCTWCAKIKTCWANLGKEFEKLKISLSCIGCNHLPKFYITLGCHHYLCKACLKALKAEKKKNQNLECKIHKRSYDSIYLNSIADNDFIKRSTYRVVAPIAKIVKKNEAAKLATNVDTKYVRESCPGCKKDNFILSEEMFLTCDHCDHVSCRTCLKGYHGYLDCATAAENKEEEQKVSDKSNSSAADEQPSTSKESTPSTAPNRNRSDAESKPYEIEFYSKHGELKGITANILDTAFRSPYEALTPCEKVPWPWEILTSNGNGLAICDDKYRSLKMGNWVEDELLETTLNIVIQQNGLQDDYGFLESYAMKYGANLSYEDEVLQTILLEKNLVKKKMLLALVNTDFEGHGGHWVLAVINMTNRSVLLLDSSLVLSQSYYRKPFFVLLHILYVAFEMAEEQFNPTEWKLMVCLDSVQQQNSHDCGIIAVCNAFTILQKNIMTKLPLNTIHLREWILYTLESSSKNKASGVQDCEKMEQNVKLKKLKPSFNPRGLQISFCFFNKSGLLE